MGITSVTFNCINYVNKFLTYEVVYWYQRVLIEKTYRHQIFSLFVSSFQPSYLPHLSPDAWLNICPIRRKRIL